MLQVPTTYKKEQIILTGYIYRRGKTAIQLQLTMFSGWDDTRVILKILMLFHSCVHTCQH